MSKYLLDLQPALAYNGDNTKTGEECGFIKHRNWSAKEKNNMKVDADDLKGDSEVNKEDPIIIAAEELYNRVRAEFK